MDSGSGNVPVGPALEGGSPFATSGYDRQLSCQIWSLDGKLVGRSTGAPLEPLGPDGSGFSERSIHGETDQLAGIAVIDDGPGIPDDELESVRDRFVRGKREKDAGSGLGLSIVELVLERAGGVL